MDPPAVPQWDTDANATAVHAAAVGAANNNGDDDDDDVF
jgi:hypothetical protein